MINPRVKYSIGHNAFKLWLDNSSFPFIQGNENSRKAALEKLMQHGTKVIAALEQHAGRPLLDSELTHGVEHKESRTTAEQIADSQPDSPKHFDSREQNPYTLALQMKRTNQRETREEMLKRKEAEWNESKARTEAQKEFDNDPRRVKAKARIESLIAGAKYDSTLTQSDVDDLTTMLQVAKTADNLNELAKMEKAWHARQRDRVNAEVATVDSQLAALKQRKSMIESRSAELEMPKPGDPEQPQSPRYEKILLSDPRHPQYTGAGQG